VRIEKFGTDVRLRFKDIQESDAGFYKCVGTLANQKDEKTIEVEVSDAKKKKTTGQCNNNWSTQQQLVNEQQLVNATTTGQRNNNWSTQQQLVNATTTVPLSINSPKEQFGIIDQDGVVKCEATGKPVPTITWKFENGTLIKNSDKYVISSNTLTIKKLTFEDSLKYNCYIYVEATGDDQDYLITYDVVKPPTISLLPTFNPANPKVGDTVEIRCLAEGQPKPIYTFFRGENPVSEDKVDKVNGILTLTNVQREDEATYKCVASNKGGTAEKSNTLDVKIFPTITEINDVMDAYEGNKVSLRCSAEGDPEPTVTWKKDGLQTTYLDTGSRDSDPVITTEDVNNLVTDIVKRQTKILTFNAIRPEDSGTYLCSAFNLLGSTNRTAQIAVKYKPHFNTDFKVTEFWGWPGHTANLTCQASANELATIQWFQPDKESEEKLNRIDTRGPYIVSTLRSQPEYHLSSSSLLITLGTAEQAEGLYGKYVCEASNTLGNEKQMVTLKQATAPGQPKVKVVEALSTSAKLILLKPDNNGGVEVTSYKYKFIQNGNQLKEEDINLEGDETPLEVKSLQAGTRYTVEVSARNGVGIGSPVTVPVKTLDMSRPEKLSIDSPQIGNQDTEYILQWSDPVDGGSPITGYKIIYRKCLVENENADPKQWKVKSFFEKENEPVSVEGSARYYNLQGLDSNSFYELRITATNKIGESDPAIQIIKTATQGTASLSTGPIIGIVISILVIIAIVIVVVVFVIKKKPELVQNWRERLPGKAGEEERGKKDDGKDTAEEEKLIKKEDTVKIENEQEETKNDVIEEHPEEFEPDSKPAQPEADKPAAVEKTEELKTPAATTEIKITPETPEKPENPAA
ncbi:hypothetical protein Btru_064606, partial [Bulinus truncatus]